MKFAVSGLTAALAVMLCLSTNEAQDKAKHTIPEVMKTAHKGGLMQKVAKGDADQAEKDMLVELYTSLSQNKPPANDDDDWKERTGKLVKAAKAAAKGDEKAAKALPKLAKCADCHKLHK